MRTFRTGVIAVAVIAVLLLPGCARGSGATDPEATPTIPAADPTAGPGIPKDADLIAWADGVLPENQLGGADWVQREVGVVGPGEGELISDVSQDAGLWAVTIACISETGRPMSYELTVDGEVTDGEIGCTDEQDPGSAAAERIPFEGGVATQLRFSASERTGLVYQVSPAATDD